MELSERTIIRMKRMKQITGFSDGTIRRKAADPLSVPSAKAETYRVSTAEFPEAEAIARLLKEVYRQIGHDFELVFRPQ